jgi:hypothetical protein
MSMRELLWSIVSRKCINEKLAFVKVFKSLKLKFIYVFDGTARYKF